VAGSRQSRKGRKPRYGGESTRRGKASWFGEAVVFDETAAEAGLAVFAGRIRPKGRSCAERPRQRASEATSQARLAVDNAVAGRRSAEELSIEAPPGPRSVRPSGRSGLRPQTRSPGGYDDAEAGGSPSSEAPPGDPPEAIGRGRVGDDRKTARSEDRRARESGSLLGARVVGRLQKSGRRIFPAPRTRSREANRDGDGIARSDPPAFDEAAKVRGERQGARRSRAREQQARPSLPGSRGPGRSDRRRSGPFGARRPKPTAGPAGLARRSPPRDVFGRRMAGRLSRPFEARVEPALLRDVARQRASEVRTSGQASSADGRRRSVAAGGSACLARVDLRAAPGRSRAEATTVKSRAIRGWNRQRELSDPPSGADDER